MTEETHRTSRIPAPASGAARRPLMEALRHRNYALFLIGLGPAATSSWMQRVGVGWLAWQLTESPVWLAVIASADLVPLLVLSPVAGVILDRVHPLNALRITQWLQCAQAFALAGAMWAGVMTIELLFALTLFLGIVHAFSSSARHAVVPHTVPRELVPAAVSL
ncbi:MAG: MFS transporter, partial [Alphaproteobacteria bacterium]|nr:MFS transporter [Alphaproteobacteria bacterium]